MADTNDLVATVNGQDGNLRIRYLGPVGLRGGRYRITATDLRAKRSVDVVCNLVQLVGLDGDLLKEIRRAQGWRPPTT